MSALLDVFRHEFRRIFTVMPAFSVIVLGAAFYALFYPQPYLNEALRNVPIAVVDRDGTQSSRDFARRVDATPDVAITEELPDLASAEREVYARKVDGILVIPQHFERELLHGRPSPVAIIAGKLLAYLALEAVILPAYLVVLPYLYGLPRLGGIIPILIFAVPFVLSVAGLGFVVAGIFRRAVRVQLILAAAGLPLFMVAGFSWPSEAIPPIIRIVSYLVPSTSAIDGFVKLSQLGAPLPAVNPELLTLSALAIFYNLIALLQTVWGAKSLDPVENTLPAS